MWGDNDCERIFYEEIRDKKKQTSGSWHNSGRKGTRGIKGSLHMPNELLKYNDKQAYKKYIEGSVITVSNIYSDINNLPKITEIVEKDYEAAHSILTAAKGFHVNRKLLEYWGISCGSLYGFYKKFGVEKKDYSTRKSHKEVETAEPVKEEPVKEEEHIKTKEEKRLILSQALLKQEAQVAARSEYVNNMKVVNMVEEVEEEDFNHKYNKKFINGAEMSKRILDIMTIIYQDKNYEVKFSIRELPENS